MKRNSIILLFYFVFFVAQAQIWTKALDEDLYNSRVKLIDEFMDRFNGKEISPNLSSTDSMLLEKNICNLFDMEMVMGQSDSVRSAIIEFAQEAVASGVKLNYSDTTWYAKATCMGTLKSKPIEFTLFLRVEPRGNDMYKWVISKAEGDIFNLTPNGDNEKVMIGPDSHETNFMKLHDLTNTKDDYITLYAQNSYQVDPTTVFYTLVYNNLLNIDGVVDLEFTFEQIPNYVFSIKNFERESSNAGWLISRLEKNDTIIATTNSK